MELTEKEVPVLKYGLKHVLLAWPKESEMNVIVEDIWDQILQNNVLKEDHISKRRLQTALRAFCYNYLDIDCKEFGFDQKRINTIRNLQDKYMILKPDKGQGVVLIKKSDYQQSMERLFSYQRKFKVLNEDPSIRNLRTVQNYLNTLYDRGEITELENKEMRPKFPQTARTDGLPNSQII